MQRLRITPDGVDNMGKQSTMPELDLIDELFWRLSEGKSTANIATLQVSQLLRPQIVDAKRESHKIEPNFFSVGVLDDFSVHRSRRVRRCVSPLMGMLAGCTSLFIGMLMAKCGSLM